MIKPFTKGNPETVRMMNELVHALNNELRMTGDGFINVQRSPTGTTLSLSMNELKARFMNFGGGGDIHQAYVKTTPGATTTLACYLDVDATGTEIDVACVIDGGGNLNACVPSVVDGDYIWVKYVAGAWVNVTPFMAVESCD